VWSGDSSGSLGGVGVSGGGEASAISGDEGGVDGGKTDDVGGVDGSGVVGGIANGGVTGGGVTGGGVTGGGITGGGIAGADRGERSSPLTSSRSHSNSTLFCLRLVLFAGGEWTSGEERIGWAGGGGEGAGSVEIPPAAVTGGDDCAGSSPAAVAACPRLRRRCLLAAVFITVEAGRLHETVKNWFPAAWLIVMRASKPLAMQRS
jgi:hypothetical protein